MQELLQPTGLVAVAAAVGTLLTLVLAVLALVRVRGLRRAQSAVLGDGRRDLVAHAEILQTAFGELRDWVEDSMRQLDGRTAAIERRLDGCLAYHSVIRYDAYGEMSGRQSSSVALLDANQTGVVISSILHRDQARIYVKPVRHGEPELELSPEESEAVEAALAAERV
jgi:Protein of unknown function (DUF4446)